MRGSRGLGLVALGIVFGDIGTSPLYAFRESIAGLEGVLPARAEVLGVLSLITWALLLVVTTKYLFVVMRADNRGEGGILALLPLAMAGATPRTRSLLAALALAGVGLLFGDGMLTPAVSVLSAVEGLAVRSVAFAPLVVPVTVAILAALFLAQSRGTEKLGVAFGPVMAVWFGTLALLGGIALWRNPGVLAALWPGYAITFGVAHGFRAFVVLGAVFLAVTGGEALYADMGHVGRTAIRRVWLLFVLPALLLNYYGQGALALEDPATVAHPFYALVPHAAIPGMVVLATLATVIASQAMITGAFSLARQAVQLGLSPRLEVRHTSPNVEGQIYLPLVNGALFVGSAALVLAFQSSGALTAAYGIAVSATMAITSVLLYPVAVHRWRWPSWAAVVVVGLFLVVDGLFLSANLLKVAAGGWVPVAVAALVFLLLATWQRGRNLLSEEARRRAVPMDDVLTSLVAHPPTRVSGAAVFLARTAEGAPPLLLHHLKHNKVLHERVLLVTIEGAETPTVAAAERVTAEPLPIGIWRVTARFGFLETPDIEQVLAGCRAVGVPVRTAETSFYLGRMTIRVTSRPGLARWRKHLFATMARNARDATDFFRIPSNRVVELGAYVEL